MQPHFLSGKTKIKIIAFVVLLIVSLLYLTPIIYGFLSSFRSYKDIMNNPGSFFPTDWTQITLDGYAELFSKTKFDSATANEWYPIWNWLLNSLIVSIVGTVIYLLLAALAAYAFVFLEWKHKDMIFNILISTLVIPGIISTTPQLINMNLLGAYKSIIGLIIPSLGGVYGVYLIRQFLIGIPKELVENARIDGASNFEIFIKVILPLAKSVLWVQGLFGFMGAWNDVQWAQLIIGTATRDKWTLAYGLKVISDNAEAAESLTLSFASAMVAMIPIFIVYLFAQSKIIEGVANTGVKR